MSTLTVTDTLSVPEALAVVRDILAQTDGDAVVLALRQVGPLVHLGDHVSQRYSLTGPVGMIQRAWLLSPRGEPLAQYRWNLLPLESRPSGDALPEGSAATVEEADAAMVAVLRARGWHCVGAP